MILFSNPKAQYELQKAEIDAAIGKTLSSGRYILGEEVEAFESEFSSYIGMALGIGVGSGTDAITIGLKACDIGVGDEVITVSHTAVATVAAIRATGATPILVDTDDYYTIDTRQILQSITPKTKAIVAVHLYGQACDLDSLQKICEEKKILLIEDCAQSHGARYEGRRLGSFGKISCFSFYPTKNLGAIGDGGMILTNDKKIAEKARLVREYGWAERYISKIEGTNSRLDSLQAAILRIKLKGLDQMNGQRQEIADSYNRRLFSMGITIPKMREKSTHVYHLYVIESSERDALQQKLHHQGVGTGIHYPMPIHLQPAYFSHVKTSISMKNTERQAKCVLSLPIYPGLRSEQTETVLRILEKNTKMAA